MPRALYEPIQPTQLRLLLKKHGISQSAFAAGIGFSTASVSLLAMRHQYPRTGDAATEMRVNATTFFTNLGIAAQEITDALDNVQPNDEAVKLHQTIAFKHKDGGAAPRQEKEEKMIILPKTEVSSDARRMFRIFNNPFADVNNRADVFMSGEMFFTAEVMASAAKNGSFLAVVGESGSGKTVLRQELHEVMALESRPVKIVEPFVIAMKGMDHKNNPTLSAKQIAHSVISAIDPNLPHKQEPQALFAQMSDLLKSSYEQGNRHVLLIEEAHDAPTPTLKHLKRILELKIGHTRLIGVILIGQPELLKRLNKAQMDLREVFQRCEIHTIPPLGNDLEAYLVSQLKRANKQLTDVFESDAIAAIRARLTAPSSREKNAPMRELSYPLVINNFCAILMNAAAMIGQNKISAELVNEVAL